jgi:hypothetical protein
MNRSLGIALLIVGAVLIVFGISAADSFASNVKEFFTGSPTDKSIWLLVAGIVAAVVGFFYSMGSKKA